MSRIKSYSVGDGDMFYIDHTSDSFTVIDCCLDEDNKSSILDEISTLSKNKGIKRFISTHPDEDHIQGIEELDDITIPNFYCVENNATKEDESESFKKYKELRGSDTAFYLKKGCTRKWLNESDGSRGSAGIHILWPKTEDENFKEALQESSEGKSPNNISSIIKYSLNGGVKVLWMGDLETDFMEDIEDEVELEKVDILFAPHHGRDSGKVPQSMLDELDPRIIVIGESSSDHLNYYRGYDTITQNSAGDIIFDCLQGKVHIFTSKAYEVDFLVDEGESLTNFHYLGTLKL